MLELQHATGEVDPLPGQAQNLPFPHPGVQRDRDNRQEIWALSRLRLTRGQKAWDLIFCQEAQPPLRLPTEADLGHLGDVAPLLREPQQVAEDGELPVDRGRSDQPAELRLLDHAIPLILRCAGT